MRTDSLNVVLTSVSVCVLCILGYWVKSEGNSGQKLKNLIIGACGGLIMSLYTWVRYGYVGAHECEDKNAVYFHSHQDLDYG